MLRAGCYVRVLGAWCLVLGAGLTAQALTAQTPIDGVALKVGSDIITQSDVRQARLLKLVEAADGTDQAYLDAVVNRRLILAELKRSPPPEPLSEAVENKRRQWAASLGGADPTERLARAGMSEAGLRGWLRDDLRIQAYLDQRFASAADRARDIAAWIADLHRRAGLR